jgi:hypothetical protein
MEVYKYLRSSGLQPTASVSFNDLAALNGEVPESDEEKKKREAEEKKANENPPAPAP